MRNLEVIKSSLRIGLLLIVWATSVWNVGASPIVTGQVGPVEDGAATMLVTKTADTNDGACNVDCSLREAIATVSIGGTITFSAMFDSPQTITLTLGELVINKALTITGPGARILTISGNNTSRVFNIPNVHGSVNISALTIANGAATDTGGAGIRAFASNCILSLTAVTLRNNNASGSGGGGAIISNATLNITRSTITNNTAFQGAGINHQAGGNFNISNSTISNNVAGHFGGAMIKSAGAMILNNVTVSRNSAIDGGALWGGGAEIRNSIIAGNTSTMGNPDLSSGNNVSRGNNLLGINQGVEANFPAGSPNANGDWVGTAAAPIDPRLTPLQNLGGPTDLHVSLSNSLARNNGNNCVTNLTCPTGNPSVALTTDQRGPGFPRLFTNVDIGAYEANSCTFTLSSPSTIDIDSRPNTVGFSIATTAGCAWNAVSTVPWMSLLNGGSGTGNGSTAFSIQANSGTAARTGTITAGDQVFTVNQAGMPTLLSVCAPQNEGDSGMTDFIFTVTLSPASAQTVTVNYSSVGVSATPGKDFISVSGVLTFLPGQTTKIIPVPVIGDTLVEPDENFRVILSNPTNALLANGGLSGVFIINDDSIASAPYDFDGDGRTDIGIFRPGVAEWWIRRSSNGSSFATQFGATTDKIIPTDFTGDGKADIAVFRPASGEWFVLRSEDFSYYSFSFGVNGDVPTPADYDDDGEADVAVFRPSDATWYIRRSSDGVTTSRQFGASSDVPVPADYDGDGKADIAVFRPSNGQWWLNRSTAGVTALTFGTSSDKPVQGDYTGDGKADIAFWRPSTGEWFVLRSNDLSYYVAPFGTAGDIPAPGDYDGDGKFDTTVFRPSSATWYSQRSTAGTLIQQFGANGDRPIGNSFVP